MRRTVLFLFLTAVLSAQSPKEVEITAEPHHRLVFENAQVRVFFVDVAPHTDTLMHAHRHDYIYVMLGASEVVNQVQGQPPVTAKLTDGQSAFIPGHFSHVVRNLDHPFRNLTVELLQDDKLRQSPTHRDPAHPEDDRGLEILHGGTEETLFVMDRVRVSEFELQPGGVAPLHQYTGPHLLVAVTDMGLQEHHPTDVHPPDLGHVMSGQVTWLPAGYSSSLTNTGKTRAKFVTLEFPKD